MFTVYPGVYLPVAGQGGIVSHTLMRTEILIRYLRKGHKFRSANGLHKKSTAEGAVLISACYRQALYPAFCMSPCSSDYIFTSLRGPGVRVGCIAGLAVCR